MIVRGQKTSFFRLLGVAVDKHDLAFYDFERTHDFVPRLFDIFISLVPLGLSLGSFLDCRVLLLFGRVHIELFDELREFLAEIREFFAKFFIGTIVRIDISSTHHMAVLVCLLNLGKKF